MAGFPVTLQTGKRYQVDKSYIWLGPLAALVAVVAVAVVGNIDDLVKLYFLAQDGRLSVSLFLIVAIAVVSVAAIFGLLLLIYWLSWRNMFYVFDERELSFYSGVIVKKKVHLPYERIQSVNQRASILQRIIGVCTVVIDSAGGSSNKGVRIPYVRLAAAERIRNDVFARKAAVAAGASVEYIGEVAADVMGAPVAPGMSSAPGTSGAFGGPAAPGVAGSGVMPQPVAGAAPQVAAPYAPNTLDSELDGVARWRGIYGGSSFENEPVSYEFGLSNKQLLLASILHPGSLVMGLVGAVTMLFVTSGLFFVDDFLSTVLLAISLPLIIGGAIVAWIATSAGLMLSYGNFKVRRRGSRVEVERGLITRTFSGIDVSRIQSVEVRQSFFKRLMGYCELSFGRIAVQSNESSSNNNASAQYLVIHPFLEVKLLNELLDGLLPEFADRPRMDARKPVAPVALRRALLRQCLWTNWALWCGIVCIIVLCLMVFGALEGGIVSLSMLMSFQFFARAAIVVLCVAIVACTVIIGVNAVYWARNAGYVWNHRYLLLHNGGLATSTSLIPRQKIQSGHTRTNPFQRHWGIATIVATTAAGTRSTSVRLIDVPQADAEAYLDWLQ